MGTKTAIIFGALSPYHIARCRAAQRKFSEHDNDLVVIQRVGSQEEYPWFGKETTSDMNVINAFGESRKEPNLVVSAKKLFFCLERIKPDHVAFGMGNLAYLGALTWCRIRKRRAILFSESKLDDMPRRSFKERIKKHIYGCFDGAIVGGAPHLDYSRYLGISSARSFFGYDVVDNDYFNERASEFRNDAVATRSRLKLPEKYFVAANRFVEKKNLLRLLRAYGQYRERVGKHAWKLVLLGDGPDKGKIMDERNRLGIEEWVILPGLADYRQLPAYLGLAEGFVHASTVEQWGLVINEAMASGLPILISNTCGCATSLLQERENGYSFDPLCIEEIANTLQLFHGHEDKRRKEMGQRSLDIISNWGPERFANALWEAVKS